MKILFFLLFLSGPLSSWAALPPLYQSNNEISAILSNSFLHPFTGESIVCLKKIEGGYLLETTRHCFLIDVKNLHTTMPGPISFSLEFHEPILKKDPSSCACAIK